VTIRTQDSCVVSILGGSRVPSCVDDPWMQEPRTDLFHQVVSEFSRICFELDFCPILSQSARYATGPSGILILP